MPPTPDRPFAVWTVFRGLSRWYFARGCPPPLRATSGWVRALHTSVLLGTMGLAWSAVGVVVAYLLLKLLNAPPLPFPTRMMLVTGTFGLIYGLGTLLPLSQWIRRPWWMIGLTVVVSALAFAGIDALFWIPISAWTGRRRDVTGALTWSCIGLLLGLCFADPSKRRTWWMLPMIVCGASAGALADLARESIYLQFRWPILRWELVAVIFGVQPVVLFVVVTSAALGMRLWTGDDPTSAEPEATDETMTLDAAPSAVPLSTEATRTDD